MKRKFVWLIISCLIVTTLILASCKAPAEKVTGGGTITIAQSTKIQSFDAEDGHWSSTYPDGYTHDTLLIGDWWADRKVAPWADAFDYVARSDLWTGCLAESWEMPDALTIIFNLRKGVHFQNKPPVNGREFVASDVKWHFERIKAAPKFANHAIQHIESITCPNNYKVVIKLSEPDPLVINYVGIGRGIGWVKAHEVVDEYGDFRNWRYQVGTGPWMLEDYIKDSSFTYEANPDYFDKDPQGNSLPYIDGVRVLIITDPATRIASLRTGKLDMAFSLDPIPWDQKQSLEKTNPDMQFKENPTGSLWPIWLRTNMEPYSKVKVRQALSMATNRQEIVDAIFGGNATAFNPPYNLGWACATQLSEFPANVRQIYEWSPQNIERAKALLTEAGYPDGITLTAQYESAGRNEPYANAMVLVQAQWAKIGVTLQLEVVDGATMASIAYAPFAHKGVMVRGTGQEHPLEIIMTKFRTGGAWNRSTVSDPYVDEMYDKARLEADIDKRNEILKELYQYMVEQCFVIQMPKVNNFSAWHPWIKGYQGEVPITDHGDGALLARIWLDQELRKEKIGR